MSVRGVLRVLEGGRLGFMCPGCHDLHQVRIRPASSPSWDFNGDYERPTFSPSILVRWSEPSDVPEEFDDTSKDRPMRCHSFVRDGQIQFLNDCTHALAGKTVALPKPEAV